MLHVLGQARSPGPDLGRTLRLGTSVRGQGRLEQKRQRDEGSRLIPFEVVAKTIDEPGALSALPHPVILRIVVLVWTVRDEIGLDQVLTWGGQSARARLYVNSPDHVRAEALRDYLERELPSIVEPLGVSYHLGGELAAAPGRA